MPSHANEHRLRFFPHHPSIALCAMCTPLFAPSLLSSPHSLSAPPPTINPSATMDPPEGHLWFYDHRDVRTGCFSNFSEHPIVVDGVTFPTTEHYFQAMKFHKDGALVERVRRAGSVKEAAAVGRDRSLPLRGDWEDVKVDVMRAALHAKFTQHRDCRDALLATAGLFLVEHTPNDALWGDAGAPNWRHDTTSTNTGKNLLGTLLVELRDLLGETG